jgi:hypothetical protein
VLAGGGLLDVTPLLPLPDLLPCLPPPLPCLTAHLPAPAPLPACLPAPLQLNLFEGTCYLTPLLGAWLADSMWGRYKTIIVFSCIYFLVGGWVGGCCQKGVPRC